MFRYAAVIFIFLSSFALSACADEYTSTLYKSVNPVITPAAFSSSSGFRLFGNIAQISIGTSTATGFGVNAGFLYFPYVTSPVVSATAKPQKVDLTWTASEGFLGLTPASYTVGQSLISGGPYTMYDAGNTLSLSQTNVSSGVTYYFIVKALDLFSDIIATSTEVSAIPQPPGQVTPPTPPPQGGGASGGGGGGGGGIATNATFKGKAYPLSKVTVLKDGQIAITTIAGMDANFEAALNSLGAGSYVFGVYGEDNKNRRSSIFTFPITVTQGSSAVISGIFITPTIDVDKSEVKRGDNIAILGQSVPEAEVVISINSETELFAKTNTDKDGSYLYNLDTSPLELGDHAAKSKAISEGLISSFGNSVGFKVGTKSSTKVEQKLCMGKGDVNSDCRVNLVDFSIVAYWWKRVLPENVKSNIDDKLWPDGQITLRDFSIMAYYWTG